MECIANVENFIVGENGAAFGAVNVGPSKEVDIAQLKYKGEHLEAFDDLIGGKAKQL